MKYNTSTNISKFTVYGSNKQATSMSTDIFLLIKEK